MKVIKNNNSKIQIKPPPQSRVHIETSDDLFQHHVNLLAVGKRGAGKSVFITNYLRMLKDDDKLDRLLIISPTAGSNKALLNMLGVDEEDIFDPEDKDVVKKVLDIVDGERDDYQTYLNDLDEWKQYQKILNDDRININNIDPYYLLKFSDDYGNPIKPKSKYGHRPFLHLFIDDAQSTPLFRNRRFLNLIIRHRHLGEMEYKKGDAERCGALGLSVYSAIQNLKSTGGGCPRAMRNNATQLCIVGKSKDEQELKDIYSSVAGEIKDTDFFQAYEYATAEPHNSLVIDLHPKKGKSRLRKNMNEMLYFETE